MPERRSFLLAGAVLLAGAPAWAQGPQQQARSLPDGEGKQAVESLCSSCHGVNNLFNSAGYTEAGWREVVASMIALPDTQARLVAGYLARHFPPSPARRPTLAEGNWNVKFTEWVAPTLGQRVRDPLEARDGAIWWTGMYASLVGRRDPVTGEMKEFALPDRTRPHGIAEDAEGGIWFAGNGNGTVGRVDPRTGEVKVYQTKARDPHTPLMHPNGNLYFTAQGARMFGRLNPRTGELTEVPTPSANPYGLRVDSKGTLWVAFNGPALDRPGGQPVEGAMIASVNPETLEFRIYPLPDPGTRARRLALDSRDIVWFVNSSRGRLGRLDPATGEVKEWPTPSGATSHPYAIEVVDDVIWFNESARRPDVLVRFDPATEKFQSFPIPSGVGIIRNMSKTRDGRLIIHQSSSNRFGLAEIIPPGVL